MWGGEEVALYEVMYKIFKTSNLQNSTTKQCSSSPIISTKSKLQYSSKTRNVRVKKIPVMILFVFIRVQENIQIFRGITRGSVPILTYKLGRSILTQSIQDNRKCIQTQCDPCNHLMPNFFLNRSKYTQPKSHTLRCP